MRRERVHVPLAILVVLLGAIVFDETFGCVTTVHIDSNEPITTTPVATTEQTTTQAPTTRKPTKTTTTTTVTTTTTTTAFMCPACGQDCSVVQVCNNIGTGQWLENSPVTPQGNGCFNFDACESTDGTCENLLSQVGNVGDLVCQTFSDGVACITGSADGVTGDWQTTGPKLAPGNQIRFGSYCSAPDNCKTIISDLFDPPLPQWVLTFEDDPTITYSAPPLDPLTPYTSSRYMTVTKVCCGTCQVCRSAQAVCSNNDAVFAAANAAAELSKQLAEQSPIR